MKTEKNESMALHYISFSLQSYGFVVHYIIYDFRP